MSGVVVCVHPRAAEAGVKVLEAGGNAFDAAIAAAFAQMIVTPFSCGIGGMASSLVWSPATGEHVVIDGPLRAGSLVREDMWAADHSGEGQFSGNSLFDDHRSTLGYTSICTPGAVAGFAELHRRYATIPWSKLLEPAIHIARQGFPVTPEAAAIFEATDSRPGEPTSIERLRQSPDCARIYLDDKGDLRRVDDVIRNDDYAETLERIALHGPRDFYEGDLAREIAADIEGNGGFVTLDDLRRCGPVISAPRRGRYRGFDVTSNGAPGGGPLLVELLNVMDGIPVAEMEHDGVDHIRHWASATQFVHQDRRAYLGDPVFIGDGPEAVLLSPERAARLRDAVIDGTVGGMLPPDDHPDTTHITAVDGEGNIASITHSNGQHSGIISPGLGFVYNNGMGRFDPRPGTAGSIAPGKARVHLMMPSIILRNGRPFAALGAPGANAILPGLAQTFSNVVDFGMTATEAVLAPRIHAEGSKVWCEGRTRTDVCDQLRERGFDVVHESAAISKRRSLVQLVLMDEEGAPVDAASDPRGPSGVYWAT